MIDAADDAAHVHWLGGDPDESLPGILAVHLAARVDRPVVWNTHSYLTPAQTRLLAGFVDGFVADLKFGPGPCAGELAGAADYWPVATAALRRLARGDGHLIVRHVVLPGHLACCTAPVIAWLQQELPGVRVNLLTQYEPWGRARDDPRLGRRLSAAELAVASSLKPVADGSGDDESTDGVVGHALVGLRADLPRE